MASSERRGERFLSAEQKYDLWVRMLTGQATAGENAELARLRGEVERLSTAIVEQAIELAALRGKSVWG